MSNRGDSSVGQIFRPKACFTISPHPISASPRAEISDAIHFNKGYVNTVSLQIIRARRREEIPQSVMRELAEDSRYSIDNCSHSKIQNKFLSGKISNSESAEIQRPPPKKARQKKI
jgi:hypothetical protein